MTDAQAETIANALMGAAVTVVVYYTLTRPRLRRAAWEITRAAVAGAGPWLVSEARRAWAESGSRGEPLRDSPAVREATAPREMMSG